MPLDETPLTKAFQGHLACAPSAPRLVSYYNSEIKQLKRSYSRRLNFDLAFYAFQSPYATCLPVSTTRCQNQSTPVCKYSFWRYLSGRVFRYIFCKLRLRSVMQKDVAATPNAKWIANVQKVCVTPQILLFSCKYYSKLSKAEKMSNLA